MSSFIYFCLFFLDFLRSSTAPVSCFAQRVRALWINVRMLHFAFLVQYLRRSHNVFECCSMLQNLQHWLVKLTSVGLKCCTSACKLLHFCVTAGRSIVKCCMGGRGAEHIVVFAQFAQCF